MKVHHDFDHLPEIKNPVVTTGSFDGVHVGHKSIIDRIKQLAKQHDGETVLITFHPHPRKVLYPETVGKDLFLIYSQEEKIEVLERTGLDHLIVVNFTLAFSRITSMEFIKKFLVDKIHARCVVVGFNHNFGHNREGNYDYLYETGKKFNFAVEEIPALDIEHEAVSSTRIRKALTEGNIQRANAYLDHHYFVTGKLSEGSRICLEAGFPTMSVNITEECKLVPPPGVYAVQVRYKNSVSRGMLNVRNHNPEKRFFATNISLQLYVFEEVKFSVNEKVTVLFYKKMREEMELRNREDLEKQLLADKEMIGELIF